jgi:molybdopterin-guanine dinucleotide biosynthesis protein A
VRSSLTGIHAGLFYMKNSFAFFSACDTPFLKRELVETLIENIDQNYDIIMPETAAGAEPLCAIYSKRCLKPAEQHLRENKFKIQLAFRRHRIKKVSTSTLRRRDPDLISFFNINTPGDLARAEEMAARGEGQSAERRARRTEDTGYRLPDSGNAKLVSRVSPTTGLESDQFDRKRNL